MSKAPGRCEYPKNNTYHGKDAKEDADNNGNNVTDHILSFLFYLSLLKNLPTILFRFSPLFLSSCFVLRRHPSLFLSRMARQC